jgi:hypothetical protein
VTQKNELQPKALNEQNGKKIFENSAFLGI